MIAEMGSAETIQHIPDVLSTEHTCSVPICPRFLPFLLQLGYQKSVKSRPVHCTDHRRISIKTL